MEMDSCPGGDLSFYHVFCMTQIKHVFLCTTLPVDIDYVIAGKREAHHLEAGRG